MLSNKSEKRNWNEDDTIILIWVVMKYTEYHQRKHSELQPSDWQYIGSIVPGKTEDQCKFKWLSLLKISI